MANRRKKRSPEVEAPTAERLAPYGATQVPSGAGRTGLPPARDHSSPPDASADDGRSAPEPAPEAVPEPIIDLRQPAPNHGKHAVDRRLEPRYRLTLPVAASRERGQRPLVGTTVDVSAHGMQLRMPGPPPEAQLDVVVGDEHGCAVVLAKIITHRALSSGEYHWHAMVVSADDDWFPIVQRA
jgi:hypothetical protein